MFKGPLRSMHIFTKLTAMGPLSGENGAASTKCALCKEEQAKYKCPGCMLQTCSLKCVKDHKDKYDCSGKRDKTKYVSLKEFGDSNLLSDYRLLEETHRKSDSAIRDRLIIRNPVRNWSKVLLKEARKRGIDLKFMPEKSTRRQANRSKYFKKSKEFNWHVELNFPNAEAETRKYNAIASDKDTLKEFLGTFIGPKNSDGVVHHNLQHYVTKWPNDIMMLLKLEQTRADKPRYHRLDLDKTMTENLKGKTIIEYPFCTIITSDEISQYSQPTPEESSESETSDSESDSSSEESDEEDCTESNKRKIKCDVTSDEEPKEKQLMFTEKVKVEKQTERVDSVDIKETDKMNVKGEANVKEATEKDNVNMELVDQ